MLARSASTQSGRCGMNVSRRPFQGRSQSVVVHASLKLYSNPNSRGRIIEWYLKEIGKEAEVINLDMKDKQEHKSEAFLKVNPFGKVPALEDDNLKLFESGALLTFLADKYGDCNTPELRARANQWVMFANSTLVNAVFVEQFRDKQMPALMGVLEDILSKQEYLEGKFSVADVAVGAYLLYIPAFFPNLDLSPWPAVKEYMARLAARPACAQTVAANAQARKGEQKS